MVYLSYFCCDMATARAHAERGAAAYDVARHGSIALAYGDDPGIMCLGFGASALWCLGYVDQARTQIGAALDLARRLEIPYCEALALDLATWVYLFAHDHAAATDSLNALEALATRHGFPMFVAHSLASKQEMPLPRRSCSNRDWPCRR
jgi:ATP/maltotriose-dependent transcriptional regulator MalT